MLSLKIYFKYVYLRVHVCVFMHVYVGTHIHSTHVDQSTTCGGWFPSFRVWVWGIELRSAGMVGKAPIDPFLQTETFINFSVSVFVCGGAHAMVGMRRPEDNFWELTPSLHCRGPRY